MDIYNKPSPEEFLEHHGIKGQKWGVRRFQNSDGSYTSAGKKRYGILTEAADKAEKFAKYAHDDAESYKKAALKGDRDSKRWANTSQKGEEYYTKLADNLRNRKVSDINKKELKAIEKWVKTGFFTEAELADIYFQGKTTNYLDDQYSSDNNPFVKKNGPVH